MCAVREYEKYLAHATCGMFTANLKRTRPWVSKRFITRNLAHMPVVRDHDNCSICPANLKITGPKISECLTTCTLVRVCAVREHEKYVAHATCCDV
jgi:hypothetical protein